MEVPLFISGIVKSSQVKSMREVGGVKQVQSTCIRGFKDIDTLVVIRNSFS